MKLYQLTNATPSQMMGYIIITDDGSVIAIDSGRAGDAVNFRKIVKEHGGHIKLWLFTHPHDDHHGAFIDISNNPDGITCDKLVVSRLPDEWAECEPWFKEELKSLNATLAVTEFPIYDPEIGDSFTVDNVTIDVLKVSSPEIKANGFNNSSCVFRVKEQFKGGNSFKIMFLGDLGTEGSDFMLKNYKTSDLEANMVQMAHHGQNGATKELYEAIGAKYALFPTPDWLWTNTINPQEPGKGPWKTLEVRAWMEELNTIPVTCLKRTTEITISKDGVDIKGE